MFVHGLFGWTITELKEILQSEQRRKSRKSIIALFIYDYYRENARNYGVWAVLVKRPM